MPIDFITPMAIDFTVQLAPVLWAVVALLLVCTGAIAASIDLESAEVYLGHRALLVATGAVIVLTIAALALVRPDFAVRFGLSG